jgi:hypothetical protein
MQALTESLASVVAAMACAAFAHFGVAVKGVCPDHHPAAAVRRVQVMTAPSRAAPAPLAGNQRRT